jgi:ATP-binding cassette subfamily B protein
MSTQPNLDYNLDQLLEQVLTQKLTEQDLCDLKKETKNLSISPGKAFWNAQEADPGIYLVVGGKVRLFNANNELITTIESGEVFGLSTLFPDLNNIPYTAKGALQRGTNGVTICHIPQNAVNGLTKKNPQILEKLRSLALDFQEKVNQGTSGESQSPAIVPSVVSPVINLPTPVVSANPPEKRKPQIYFPTPQEKLGFWWRKVIHRYPFYPQQSMMDCGAACLVMIGRYWGKKFSLNRVRELAQINRDGSHLKGLCTAGETLGFNPKPIKASFDQLAKQNLPAIVHWEGNHYVVLWEVNNKEVILGDPGIGQRRISKQEFITGWTGYAVLLDPTMGLKTTKEGGKAGSWWDFVALLAPHKLVVAEIFVASLLIQIFGLVTPMFTQVILDQSVVQRSEVSLTTFGVGLVVFAILKMLMTGLRQYLLDQTANRVDSALIIGFIRHTFRLPISYFDSRYVGDIISRVQENHKIQRFITGELEISGHNFNYYSTFFNIDGDRHPIFKENFPRNI